MLNAKKIVEEYGGVFISDVVGLGKTYIATMLAGQLDGRTLIIAPPVLLEKSNPGSWTNAVYEFGVPAICESVGKLDKILDELNPETYKNVIIDEAHRFRTETTLSYEKLSEICRGKRVILVTATPYNNSPNDILAQIKLFQNARRSTIPNVSNLEAFFGRLERKIKTVHRQGDYEDYILTVKENAREIREKVLKFLMVRRTRTEIVKYFGDDLKKQKLRFPEVENPEPLFYQLNDYEDKVFNDTIGLISMKFSYSRYTPLLYLKEELADFEAQSQRNMGRFMKVLLVKRLESSFFAFRKSVARFIKSYENFISEFEKGNVYVSKKYIYKIFEYIEQDNDEAIQKLIDEEKAEKYPSSAFKKEFIVDLKNDLKILLEVRKMWEGVHRDPKLLEFLFQLNSSKLLGKNKCIIFTESKETATYIAEEINKSVSGKALCFTGGSDESMRNRVIENFDAKHSKKMNDYRILVTTEVLSEGVNLHRSNIVINYDIHWNPTSWISKFRIRQAFYKCTYNFHGKE